MPRRLRAPRNPLRIGALRQHALDKIHPFPKLGYLALDVRQLGVQLFEVPHQIFRNLSRRASLGDENPADYYTDACDARGKGNDRENELIQDCGIDHSCTNLRYLAAFGFGLRRLHAPTSFGTAPP